MSIETNYLHIKECIAASVLKSERAVNSVEVVAVTKFHPPEHILPLESLGVKSIGESKIQELQGKFDKLSKIFKIHFIGHLQTNKAKQAVSMADLIHSVDSERLALAINNAAASVQKKQEILLQVNCSNEDQKGGISPSEFENVLIRVSKLANIKIIGLMTMAALTDDKAAVRASFRLLRSLRDKGASLQISGVTLNHLSMGMSHDYNIAVEEGATLVRIGSALFEGIENA